MYLLDKTEPNASRVWYVQAAIDNGWSRAVLAHQIESHLYERQVLSGTVNNFSRTLPEDYRDVLPSPEDLQQRI